MDEMLDEMLGEMLGDVLDTLFETVGEDESLGDHRGESLVIAEVALPQKSGEGHGETEWTDAVATGELPSIDAIEAIGAIGAMDAVGGVGPSGAVVWPSAAGLWKGDDSALGRGRQRIQMGEVQRGSSNLVEQMASVANRASLAQSLAQSGGGRTTGQSSGGGQEVSLVGEASATAFSVASAARRQSVATVETARTVDRAIERDARRYDGGFILN